jgi:hypothetical protein
MGDKTVYFGVQLEVCSGCTRASVGECMRVCA